jgi:hypothetical protein
MKNSLYRSKSYFSGRNLAKFRPIKNSDWLLPPFPRAPPLPQKKKPKKSLPNSHLNYGIQRNEEEEEEEEEKAGTTNDRKTGRQEANINNGNSKWQGSSVKAHRVRLRRRHFTFLPPATNNIYQQPHHLLALLLHMLIFGK